MKQIKTDQKDFKQLLKEIKKLNIKYILNYSVPLKKSTFIKNETTGVYPIFLNS